MAVTTGPGASPTGSAGGALTGTYPNPTIATGATLGSPTINNVINGEPGGGNSFQVNLYGTNGAWAIGIDVGNPNNPYQDLYFFKGHSPADLTDGNDFGYFAHNGEGLASASPVGGATGTGYAINDTITLAGGTTPTGSSSIVTPAVLVVTSVGGTGGTQVTGVKISGANGVGIYGTVPSSPTSQASTSGSGSGAQFTTTWQDNAATLRIGRSSVPDLTYQLTVTPDPTLNANMGGIYIKGANTGVDLLKAGTSTDGTSFEVITNSSGGTDLKIEANTGQASTLDFLINGSNCWYIQAFSNEIRFYDNVNNKKFLDVGGGGSGVIQIGETNPMTISATGAVTLANTLGLPVATWADNQTVTAGQISVDANYIYVATATNTVKRVALSSF